MDNQPSFGERCAQLRDAAQQLKQIAEIVALEAIRMDAAGKRFADRRASTKQKASR